jgi:hypothetical protein
VGGLITALLFFTLPSYAAAHFKQATSTPTPVAPTPTAIPITPTSAPPIPTPVPPTPTTTLQPSSITSICPPAQADTGAPLIDFCSPSFNKDVEGTVGAQVKLLVRNIFGQITGLYMVSTNSINTTTLPTILPTNGGIDPSNPDLFRNQCSLSQTKCFRIDNFHQDQTKGKFFISFLWSVSPLPPNNNYYAVLTYRDQHNAQQEQIIHSPQTRYTFTLRSTQQPCIAALKEPPTTTLADCSFPHTSLTAGSSIDFHGENWISGEPQDGVNQEINIILSCLSCQGAPKPVTIPATEKPGDSTFDQPYTLPPGFTGTFQINATNRIVDSNPATKSLSLADGAFTFNLPTSSPIHVVQPCIQITAVNAQQPTPTPSVNCQQQQPPTSMSPGSTILIQGANWFLPHTKKITIKAVCASSTACPSQQSAFQSFPILVSSDGHFQHQIELSSNASGPYDIVISMDNITFFDGKSPYKYTLSVSSSGLNPWPLLALLPAILSLLLYIATQRRRPATAPTQRMSDGTTPITRRASLPPPVTRQGPGGRR